MIITGCSRSGTSLLLALLYCTVRNKEVLIKGELNEGANHGNKISKNPSAVIEVPNLKRPCIMVRDPRSIVTSQWHTGEYFIGGDFCKNGKDPGVVPSFKAMMTYPAETYFHYEHLIRRPDQFQDRLGQYWGLEYSNEFSEWPRFPKEKMERVSAVWGRKMNKVRPFDDGHDWRDHMPRIRQQFDAFPELAGCVTVFGYETSTDWYQEVLDCTEPQDYTPPKKKVHVAKPRGLTIKMSMKTHD